MKIIRTSGFYLLFVTILSLLGAFGFFFRLLHSSAAVWWCVGMIVLLMLLPVALWTHQIEINYQSLSFKSGLRQRTMLLTTIKSISVTSQNRQHTLTVYPAQYEDAMSMTVDVFARDEIKNLLDEIKAKNVKVRITMPPNF